MQVPGGTRDRCNDLGTQHFSNISKPIAMDSNASGSDHRRRFHFEDPASRSSLAAGLRPDRALVAIRSGRRAPRGRAARHSRFAAHEGALCRTLGSGHFTTLCNPAFRDARQPGR